MQFSVVIKLLDDPFLSFFFFLNALFKKYLFYLLGPGLSCGQRAP